MIDKEMMNILGEFAQGLDTSKQGIEAGDAIIFCVMSNGSDPSIQLIKGDAPAVFESMFSLLERLLEIIPINKQTEFKSLLIKREIEKRAVYLWQ